MGFSGGALFLFSPFSLHPSALRVASGSPTPLSLVSGGPAGRRWGGRDGWFPPVNSRLRLSFSHVEYGDMPRRSSSSVRASRAGVGLGPLARWRPWRTVGSSGSGRYTLNKLVWSRIWTASPFLFILHGLGALGRRDGE